MREERRIIRTEENNAGDVRMRGRDKREERE